MIASVYRFAVFAVALVAVFACVAAGRSQTIPNAPSAVNASIGTWLPDPEIGFDAWSRRQNSVVRSYDYFVCAGNAKPNVPSHDFDYAGSACAALKGATVFAYGSAEPIRGRAVYDRVHRIVLYAKGCCAWRGFALTGGIAPPPKPVATADLSGVRTKRGVTLAMTPAQVEQIYGAATLHSTKGRPDLSTLYYSTMKGGPNSPEACGQFQSFSFKNGRLVSIELLAGC